MTSVRQFALGLPKAELHLHIEGTLEPEMMVALAARNGVDLPFASVAEVRAAYEFTDLQSFLDIYYQGAAVLQTEDDFRELMLAYLRRAVADGVRHAEVFFDPQTHTARGIDFSTFMAGFAAAREQAGAELGVSTLLIMCFLRHLPAADAMATLHEALPFRDSISGVGLDSSEVGFPPELFATPFARAAEIGWHRVAHAGEEGPPAYITGALDTLGVERIDHGVAAGRDEAVLARIVAAGVPLTMCPLSNVKLRVFDRLEDHNLKRLLEAGALVTINSDDPSYFGGYIGENYAATAEALGLSAEDLATIARNSFRASFLDAAAIGRHLAAVDAYVAANG